MTDANVDPELLPCDASRRGAGYRVLPLNVIATCHGAVTQEVIRV